MPINTSGRATDFISFSRPGATGGGATVTDRDGKIKWAGHNLLTNSESFDASAWTKASNIVAAPVVTANNAAAPNGTLTADKIAFPAVSGANANSLIFQSPTQTLSTLHTASVYLRGDVGGEVVWLAWTSDGVTYSRTQCTLTTSWQLFTLSYTTASSGTQYIQIGIDLRDGSQSAKSAQTIYAWGAHLYRSDLGGMVLNPARNDSYYSTTPRNLLGFTEDFSNAAWVKDTVRAFDSGSVANVTSAPNGIQTADLIIENAATSEHAVYQFLSSTAATNTVSVYVKSAGRHVKLRLYNATSSYVSITFDLINGTKAQTNTSGTFFSNITSDITPVGDGWYRCWITATRGTGTAIFVIDLSNTTTPAMTGGGGVSYAGDNASGIYLWGAQLSDSASLDTYSPVYSSAVSSAAYYAPRLDFDPVNLGVPKGLLIEEQRANLLIYNNQFEDANWGLASGVTVVDNPSTVTSPDGTSNADRIVPSTSPSSFNFIRRINITTANVAHTLSVYARASGYNFIELIIGSDASYTKFATAYFNVSTGAFVTSRNTTYTVADKTITPVGNGWFRCTLTVVLDATATTTVAFTVGSTADPVATFTGDGTSGVLFYGAQLEAGSFSTSLIPTGATTATRNADVTSVNVQAFPYNATEGTVVINATTISTAVNNNRYIGLNLSGSPISNRLVDISKASTDYVLYKTSDAAQFSFGGTWQQSSKIAAAYKADNYAAVANNSTAGTDTSTSGLATADTLALGQLNNSSQLNGHIRQVAYIPRRLTNAELQARTV